MSAIEELKTPSIFHMWLPPALSSLVKHGNGLLASQSRTFRFFSPDKCRSGFRAVSICSTCLFIILVAKLMFFDPSEGHGIVGIAYDQQQP